MSERSIERRNKAIVREVRAEIKRNTDDSMAEDRLLELVEQKMVWNEAAERRAKAKKLIDDEAKPGSTKPNGQLNLPGFDVPYEPDRLVRDDKGNIVENDKASPAFKVADTRRARKHADEADYWAKVKTEEQLQHNQWALAQALKGRPLKELTWGNCVREAGLWSSIPLPPKRKKPGEEEPDNSDPVAP